MPIFTIETADGRILDIEAPDDASAIAEADRWASENPKAPKEPKAQEGYVFSQKPYSEKLLRAGQVMGEIGTGMASGIGQIGTGIGELLPGRAGEVSAEATQYLKGIGPQGAQTAGKIVGSIAPFGAGAALTGAALGLAGRLPMLANLPPLVQSLGRVASGAISGGVGGAAVGATAPTGIVEQPQRYEAKQQEAVREGLLGAAFGGGFGAGGEIYRAVRSSPLVDIVGQRAAGVTQQQYDQAAKLINDAKTQFGVDLTPAEAIQAVTKGATGLGDLQRLMEQSRGGSQMFTQFMSQRPESISQAVERKLDQIAPALANPSRLEPEARRIAEDILESVATMRTRATQPYYGSMRDQEVTQNVVAGVVKDLRELAAKDQTGKIIAPVLNQLESLLIKTPGRGPTPPGPRTTPEGMKAIKVQEPGKPAVPEEYITDVNSLELARQFMREKSSVPLYGVEGVSKNQSAELQKGLKSLYERLENNVPALAQGRQEFARISRLVDDFEASVTGKFAKAETYEAQRAALFPKGEAVIPGQQGEIQRAFESIQARTVQPPRMKLPDVQLPPVVSRGLGPQLVRQELESIADRTASALTSRGIPNEYAGAAFQAAIQRYPQQYQNTLAAMRGAGLGAEVPGFERLMNVLQATGYRRPAGSDTARNLSVTEALQEGGIAGAAGTVVSPIKSTRIAIGQAALESRTREISQMLLEGEAGLRKIQQMARQNDINGEIARNILAARNIAVPGLLETRQ